VSIQANIETHDKMKEASDERDAIIQQQASFIATQKEEIDRLISIIDCNSATIISQAEEIQYSKQQIRTIRASKRKEIEKIRSKYQEDKKKYMPCYHVGRLLREYKVSNFATIAPDQEEKRRRRIAPRSFLLLLLLLLLNAGLLLTFQPDVISQLRSDCR